MNSEEILDFLRAVDAELARHANKGEGLDFYLLGRSALILGYGVPLMTKDVDVVASTDSHLLDVATRVFGKGGAGVSGNGLYLESVSSGLPPLPGGFPKRCLEVPGTWTVIRPKLLEMHDLIVTKFRRYHAGDREDIQILCDTGKVDVVTLQERFDLAYAFCDMDDPREIRARANLESVVDYLEGRRPTL